MKPAGIPGMYAEIKIMKPSKLNQLLKEAHRRQFNGEDYQKAAADLVRHIPNATDEDFLTLSSSPDEACDCGFCATADWQD